VAARGRADVHGPQVTLYAVGKPDARTRTSRSVALGRGYANTAAHSDSNVHAFKVYLREEAPRQRWS
jgi:hypothetical protein